MIATLRAWRPACSLRRGFPERILDPDDARTGEINMDIRPIDELRASGRMTWAEDHRAWVAEPDEIVSALSHCGFNEYKREETRSGRGREPSGGVWQGIDVAGSVASAVWVNRPDASIVYIDIDGEPLSSEGASPPSEAG